MMRRLLIAALLSSLLGQGAAQAAEPTPVAGADDRLMIVDGNRNRVIYDDGHDDLFCVIRRVIVGYDDWGNAVRRRRMHCR